MRGTENRVFFGRSGIPRISRYRPTGKRILYIVFSVGLFLLLEADTTAQDNPLTVHTYMVKHASAPELEPILQSLLSENGSLSVDMRTNSVVVKDTESSVDAIGETILSLDNEVPTHTFHISYASANDIAENVRRVLGTSGSLVEPDERTHTVYIAAPSPALEAITPLVSEWDKPPGQVLIEADILDVSSAKLKELGIEWELRLGYDDHDAVFNMNAGRTSTDTPATGTISFGTPSVTIPAVYDGMGNLVTPAQVIPGSDFSAAIQALIEDDSTRTLSRPRILVIDGRSARFEVSTQEPYADTKFNRRGTASSLDIQFLDVGIILETVPHINDDGFVLLDIQPEISTLVREEFFETTIIPNEGGAITNRIRVPVKSQSRAKTVIMVRDNQTIAIGGLRSSEDTEIIRKVPILGDIPILGIPFRNIHQGTDKRELIIFITPHIITGSDSSPEAALLIEDGEDSVHEQESR